MMRSALVRSIIAVSIAAVGLRVTTHGASAQIVIDNKRLSRKEILATEPLIAYRAFPKSGVSIDRNRWVVNESTLYAAAVADPVFQKAIGKTQSQIKELPFETLIDYYQHTARFNQSEECNGTVIKSVPVSEYSFCVPSAETVTDVPSLGYKLDPAIIRRAFASGAFVNSGAIQLTGMSEPGVELNPNFAKIASNAYSTAFVLSTSGQDPAAAFNFGRATRVALQAKPVAYTTAIALSNVDIGRPLILTTRDRKLQVPESISRSFDVYWLQLAVNPRVDLRDDLLQLSFYVALATKDAEALELVPLRFGKDQEIKTQTGIPELKFKAGETEVKIGQIYGEEVSYKVLKPTIVGTGLQEASFGWSLSDDMLDMSAKRLIAVIGVPRKTKKIEFDMVLTAKTSPNAYWGQVEDDVATSPPVEFSGKLPNDR